MRDISNFTDGSGRKGRYPDSKPGGRVNIRFDYGSGGFEGGTQLPAKTTGAVTRDLVLCGKRVRELLLGRPHGLFIARLEKIYEKKFNEKLPVDWSQELKLAGDIDVVKEEGGLLLVKHGEGLIVDPIFIDDPCHEVSATSDEMKRLKERILQLLQGRVDGLLVFQLKKMYFKQWSEKLEGEWVSKLEQLGGVVVDREGEQMVMKEEVNADENSNPIAVLDSGVARMVNDLKGGRVQTMEKARQVERIKQLLQGRVHGLHATRIQKLYEKNFGLTLDNTWWSELMEAGSVGVENLERGQVVIKWIK